MHRTTQEKCEGGQLPSGKRHIKWQQEWLGNDTRRSNLLLPRTVDNTAGKGPVVYLCHCSWEAEDLRQTPSPPCFSPLARPESLWKGRLMYMKFLQDPQEGPSWL